MLPTIVIEPLIALRLHRSWWRISTFGCCLHPPPGAKSHRKETASSQHCPFHALPAPQHFPDYCECRIYTMLSGLRKFIAEMDDEEFRVSNSEFRVHPYVLLTLRLTPEL